jgi:hypothetical protein
MSIGYPVEAAALARVISEAYVAASDLRHTERRRWCRE